MIQQENLYHCLVIKFDLLLYMSNLFDLLNKHENTLTSNASTKEWWETNTVQFDRNTLSPGNVYVNEKDVYEQIKKSDRNRLLKYSKL